MPVQDYEQYSGGDQGGGGVDNTQSWSYNPVNPSGNWFQDFSSWYGQMPDINNQNWDLGNLMEWQRQGQNMDPTFLQWANYFQNGGQAPQGPPGGTGGGTFPTGDQGNGYQGGLPGLPPWLTGFSNDFFTDPHLGYSNDMADRVNEVSTLGNTYGLLDLMAYNPSQSQSGWWDQFGMPIRGPKENFFQQGGAGYLDPALMEASTFDPQMAQAAQMQAALTGGPSTSRAMQMAQGAQDVAQRSAMIQSGAMAQQLGNRRMNPAAMAAVMGDLNRQAGAGAASAGASAFSQGLQADMQTNLANQQARQSANAQNAGFQQQTNLANQQAQLQAALANQQAQMQAAGANQQALNAGQQFNIGNMLQNLYQNNNVMNQDRNDRMLAWQQFMGDRRDMGQFLMDWVLRGTWGREGWIG